MELRQLKYFLKAKELNNFTEAANSLHISQSTLSQQIKQLEEELNVLLFDRVGKYITITEAGELFAEFALQSVNKANEGLELLRDLNNLNTGKITIGVTHGLRYFLTKKVLIFTTQFPNIDIKVQFGTTNELLEKLDRFEFDFILTFYEGKEKTYLKYQTLFTSPMILVASKHSELHHKKSISLKEIIQLPLVIPDSGFSTIQFMNKVLENNKLKPHYSIEINDVPTIFDFVKTGKWFTFMSEASVNDKELYTIPIKGKNMVRTATIISQKDTYEKKAISKFYELLLNK